MSNLTYYTPPLEDLHIGYHCQVFNPEYPSKDHFMGFKIRETSDWPDLIRKVNDKKLRTAHLSKEAVEAEGWILVADCANAFFFDMTDAWKGKWKLSFWPFDGHSVRVDVYNTHDKRHSQFNGSCPSINEFRRIQKAIDVRKS